MQVTKAFPQDAVQVSLWSLETKRNWEVYGEQL